MAVTPEQVIQGCEAAKGRYEQAMAAMFGEGGCAGTLHTALDQTNSEVLTLLREVISLTGGIDRDIHLQQIAITGMREAADQAVGQIDPIRSSNKKNAKKLVQGVGSVAGKVAELETGITTCRGAFKSDNLSAVNANSSQLAERQTGVKEAIALATESGQAFGAAHTLTTDYQYEVMRRSGNIS